MTTDQKIRDKKLQYGIKKYLKKYQHYYLEKNDKYEYLTGKKILPSNQRQTIEQAKFAYSPSGKSF